MIIDCISDIHGFEPKLPGGDLLILAGDYTAAGNLKQWAKFFRWLKDQPYQKKILIAGNHDNLFEKGFPKNQKEADSLKKVIEFLIEEGDMEKPDFEYLCDSGTEYEGLKIWGSPWTIKFPGMNPHCMAFTCDTEEKINEKWNLIPDDIDILITHSPAFGILDKIKSKIKPRIRSMEHVGSTSLREHVISRIKPKVHVFGHIHEGYGLIDLTIATYINASYVNEKYEPVNSWQRIEI